MAASKRRTRMTLMGADGKLYDVQVEIVAVHSPNTPAVDSAPEPSPMDWPVLAAEQVPEQER